MLLETLQSFQAKDLVTAAIAAAALLTSITSLALSYALERGRRRSDRSKAFSEAVAGLSLVRAEFDKARSDAGEAFSDSAFTAVRSTLADRRSFFMSRLVSLFRAQSDIGDPFEHLVLAASFMDRGRLGEARRHYAIAAARSLDPYAKAEAERVYGRSVMLSVNYEQGRSIMEAAATAFAELSDTSDYRRDQMLLEVSETYRRMAEAEFEMEHVEAATLMIQRMKDTVAKISSPELKRRGQATARSLFEWHDKHTSGSPTPALPDTHKAGLSN